MCCYYYAHDGRNNFWLTLAHRVRVVTYNICLTLFLLQHSNDIVATALGLSANHVEGMSQSQLRNTSLNTHTLTITVTITFTVTFPFTVIVMFTVTLLPPLAIHFRTELT